MGGPRLLRLPAIAVRLVVLASLASLVAMGACGARAGAGASVPRLAIGAHGYVVAAKLRSAPPGRLIAARRVPGVDRTLGSARRWQFTYHSTDLGGRDVAVSGLVLLPTGRTPPGGWRLVAWAHGTTGLADVCAPSLAPQLGHDASAVREVRNLLANRFAVVATDYPGLGTPGVHPYLVGRPDGVAVVDSVTAAHQLVPHAFTRAWVSVGHSEGGQTALFTAQYASSRAPQWDYRGTVALAPASTLEGLVPLAAGSHDPVEQAYLMYAVVGLGVVDGTVHPRQIFSAEVRPRLGLLAHGCIDDITASLARHPVAQVLDVSASRAASLAAELGRYDDPDRAPATAPVLVLQGTADTDVPAGATTALVDRLRALGDDVEYRQYAGLDHEGVVTASRPDVVGWITTRFAATP